MNDDPQIDSRRPIAARNTGWADGFAASLARTGITPNQISVASMIFGLLAALLYFATTQSSLSTGTTTRAVILILAIFAIQFRLLCNLFDGMVAVEGGKGAKDGPFWNEFPDRVSDLLIFVGAGYAAHLPELGFAAGGLAVLVAYVRELGRAVGMEADFSGPMAKQHRMALLSVGTLIAAFEPMWGWDGKSLRIVLAIIIIGSIITVLRRATRQVTDLKNS